MYILDDILGESEEIIKVKNISKKVCNALAPVLIYGETGTGKEMIAQGIHYESNRKLKPFIAQNCAAIPENLLEAIFFGATKGSFTGAKEQEGLFEAANHGTLYLDELNSMDVVFQSKILRVIQEQEFMRIGENKARKIDVRIIASINEEPNMLIENNKLRKDLFYRLNVIRIDLPTLDERKKDIPILVESFIKQYNMKCSLNIKCITKQAMEAIVRKSYKGNIRELQHLIESAMIFKKSGVIDVEDLNISNEEYITLKAKLEKVEKQYILDSLVVVNFNISKASKLLGIPRQTLQYKIKKYDISLNG